MTPSTAAPERPWLKPPIVVKVGGSLFDWPELAPRLRSFLASLAGNNILLIPGGGSTTDVIRQFDQTHKLSDETSHLLAVHSLTLNARFLQKLIPSSQVIEGLNAARSCWRRGALPVLDMYRFVRGDDGRPDHPPHKWDVTSDSLAARVAVVAHATKLILLKSVASPAGTDWTEAGRKGYVDPYFAGIVAQAPFSVQAIDLRKWK